MPGLRKTRIAERIVSALIEGAAQPHKAAFSGERSQLPWMLTVGFPGEVSRRYQVYMWTIGHGGRTRSKNEYRIQTKLDDGRRRLGFGFGTTVLLGYYDESADVSGRWGEDRPPPGMSVFVAWDAIEHLKVGTSSSCQVPFDLMEQAHLRGVAERRRSIRGGDELVVAMRPEYLAPYLLEAAGGHRYVAVSAIERRASRLVR